MKRFLNISERIAETTGLDFKVQSFDVLGGGDINSAYRLKGVDQCYFVKLNRPELVTMFAAEFSGLNELASTQTLRVPKPVVYGQNNENSFLVLEYLELSRASKTSERLLGQQLAKLHAKTQPFFGFSQDNTIGSTPQLNTLSQNWLDFWRNQRLAYQLQLAAIKGYGGRLQTDGEKLMQTLPALFADYSPQPSLLHGDLWAGNAAADNKGNPVIFDPACYYGDRETDIAMTELFGGFGADFYAAYGDVWKLDSGYKTRRHFYNLYHILNHLNLFGGSYLRQAENMLTMILAETGA